MANHPNRSRRVRRPATSPSPDAIRAARLAAGLTQREAAAAIYATLRAWEAWEQGERPMHPGLFELFILKTHSSRADANIYGPATGLKHWHELPDGSGR